MHSIDTIKQQMIETLKRKSELYAKETDERKKNEYAAMRIYTIGSFAELLHRLGYNNVLDNMLELGQFSKA